MISELVPERRRPLALAVFGLASSLGFIVFYPLVGWIGQRYGWRGMFVSSGLPGRTTWMVGFALMSFFALAHQAPIFAAVMSTARLRMRAVAISMLVLASGFLGQIVGPLLVGMLDDWWHASLGDSAVRYSLLLVACCLASASLAFFAAIRSFEADKQRAVAS